MRTDSAALEVLAETGRQHVWYGDPDLVADIAERAGHKPSHPLNRSAAVMCALAKSPLFWRKGSIEHMGRHYPVYAPKKETP
jgi:hypothetical protein